MAASRRRWLLIPALAVLLLVTAALGHRLAVQSRSPLSMLSDDYRTGGGAGLFLWARKLSIHTGELHGPLWELHQEFRSPGNCVITAGDDAWNPYAESDEDSLTKEQWAAVQKWIEAGNTLIVVTSRSSTLPDNLQDSFKAPSKDGHEPHFAPASSQTTSLQTSALEVPLAWGGKLAVAAAGPRLTGAPADWIVAGTPESAVLVQRDLGQGRLYLLLDRDAWSNAGLDRADNAAALYRILHQELGPGGVLAVDQYRHGRGRVESFATYLLGLPGASACGSMLLLWVAVWVWSRNQRLGPADVWHEVERRTAREYVEAVAAMNQRARAAPLAVKAVHDRVLSLLRHRGASQVDLQRLEQEAQRIIALKDRPSAPKAETAVVCDLINLRKQIYGSREDSGSGVADEGGASKSVLRPSGRR